MQAIEFSRGLSDLAERLRIRKLVELLAPLMEGPDNDYSAKKGAFATLLFDSRAALNSVLAEPGSPQRQLAEAFQLDEILSPLRLSTLNTHFQTGKQPSRLKTDLDFQAFYAHLTAFDRMSRAAVEQLLEARVPKPPEGQGLLELVIANGETPHTPESLAALLTSIGHLIRTVARLHGSSVDPIIWYLDSGSPLGIGVTADGETVRTVKDMFADAIKAIRFWKQDTVQKNLVVSSDILTFLWKVDEAMAAGTLDADSGEQIKKALTQNLERLLGSGVAPRAESLEDVKGLEALQAARQPLQLTSGEESTPDGADGSPPE